MSLPSTPADSQPRLYYLDWLRVLGMFGIFFFHNARFYDALAIGMCAILQLTWAQLYSWHL